MPAARGVDRGGGLGTWLNAAMLHRWVKQAERSGRPIAIRTTAPSLAIESGESFVPVALPWNAAEGTIRIEVRRRGSTVKGRVGGIGGA